MEEIKVINVYTFGDAAIARTWSNVPFLLCKTLEEKGYKVNRINIVQNRWLQAIYHRLIHIPLIKIGLRKKDTIYHYNHSYINYKLTSTKIKWLAKKFNDANLNLFTNFSFVDEFNGKPNVLFCDWDITIAIVDKLGRKPYSEELGAIRRQKSVIEKADLLVSMFADASRQMKLTHATDKIHHLNQNVINNLYPFSLNPSLIMERKRISKDLLFIGTDKYLKGATLLVEVFDSLRHLFPDLKLHLVGIKKADLKSVPEGVICYGYLDKSNPNESAIYYELLKNARMFINPTPLWGAYSATVEAMFFFNPVIVAPYGEFVNDFGDDIDFGQYCYKFEHEYLKTCILSIIHDINYDTLCSNAHKAVEKFTWSNYVDKLLDLIDKKIISTTI